MDEIAISTKSVVSGLAKYNVHSHLFSLLLSIHCLPSLISLVLSIFSEIQIIALLTLQISEHFTSQKQDSGVLGIKNLASAAIFQLNYNFSGEDKFTNAVTVIIGIYFLLILLVAATLADLWKTANCFKRGVSFVGSEI